MGRRGPGPGGRLTLTGEVYMKCAAVGLALLVASCSGGPNLVEACAALDDAGASFDAWHQGLAAGARAVGEGESLRPDQARALLFGAEWSAFKEDLRSFTEAANRSGHEGLKDSAAGVREAAVTFEATVRAGGEPSMKHLEGLLALAALRCHTSG